MSLTQPSHRQGLQKAYPHALMFNSCPPDTDVSCISPAFYAVIGAASMLGGVTRMTSGCRHLYASSLSLTSLTSIVSLVVILFEVSTM